MSKRKRNMYGRDKDGYLKLVPRLTCVQGNSIHRGENSAEYWEKRCKEAERKYDKLKRTVNKTYGKPYYDDTLEEDLKIIEQMEQEIMEEERSQSERSEQKPASSGIGISFGPGKDPKLYRTEDPDGPLIPRETFVGGEIEIDPGRGFHFGLHWDRK